MSSIVSTTEVMEAVGISVSDQDILKAQRILEDRFGTFSSAANYYIPNDLRLLKSMVIWETLYLKDNPDVLTAAGNIASESTNGISVSYVQGVDVLIAPLALVAAQGLSWNGSMTTVPISRGTRQRGYRYGWEFLR